MSNCKQVLWRKEFILSATFFLALLLSVSCKKKLSSIGESSIDQSELLSSDGIDTFSLTTFSIVVDSIITDNSAYGILGIYNDPEFGPVSSEIYTEFRLVGVDPIFGEPKYIEMDSMVLALEYTGFYGNTGTQTFEVYELNEGLHIDSVYYANTSKADKGIDLVLSGDADQYLDVNDLTVVDNDTISSQLRINLDPSLGMSLILEAAANPSTFSTNEDFLQFFKGLRIKTTGIPTPNSGGLFYFDLNDPSSKITMYYKESGVSKQFDFVINSSCADFNHVDTDNSMTNVETVVNDTISGQVEFYAQSFNSRAVVQIPGLDNIPSTAVVHKAILDLPIEYQTGHKYSPGDLITVSTRSEAGSNAIYSIGVIGEYSETKKAFTMDIRNYVQSVVSGISNNTELILSPFFFIASGDRIIFNGASTTNKSKPKFSIIYTEFN